MQAFLLRVMPAAVMFLAFDFFHPYEPTPKYTSSGAFLLLGFSWLFNGPTWRTTLVGMRWSAWWHALVFCVVPVVTGYVLFMLLKAEWTGLWLLLIGIAVQAMGPEEPKEPVPVKESPAEAAEPPLLQPIAPVRRSKALGWWAGGLALALVLTGMVLFLAGGPADSQFKEKMRAGLGSPEDQLALGWRYREGRGVPQDYARAAELFEQAAAKGLPRAEYDLAVLLYYGLGRPADEAEARRYLELAVNQDYPPAMTMLGLVELGTNGYPSRGFELLERAAGRGDPQAGYLAGLTYCARRRENTDYLVRGLVWLERACREEVAGAKENTELVWASIPAADLEIVAEQVYRQVNPTP